MLSDEAPDTFREYLRTVVSAATACSSSEDARFQTVGDGPVPPLCSVSLADVVGPGIYLQAVSALRRFAQAAAETPERLGTPFLTELLTLHAAKSIALTKVDPTTHLGEVSRSGAPTKYRIELVP